MPKLPLAITFTVVEVLVVGALASAIGCGGRYGGRPSEPKAAKRGIVAAALPYRILDARTGRQLDEPAFWQRLETARAVCVGEDHSNPHHHWWQLEVVKQLGRHTDRPFALGLEMVQRPFQGVLDDYEAKRIDAAAMQSRTGWEDRWGYDYSLYGPIIDQALAVHGHLIALNAPRELTKKVGKNGLASLTPEERAQLPELKLDDAAHRAWFDATMESMGGARVHSRRSTEMPEPSPDPRGDPDRHPRPAAVAPPADQIYAVQVIWDETMADIAASWLTATPSARMVLLAGNGHCHDSAIMNRLKRRGISDAVSLRPVIDSGDGAVAEVLAKPTTDYVVVLEMPR